MSDILDMVYDSLKKEIAANKKATVKLLTTTEQSQYVDGIPAYTFANLPTDGLANGTTYLTIAFCSNGRKGGEGAGNGTGVPVYWNSASSQWLKFSDDTVVTV